MKIKKNDTVEVIAGKDRGKRGKVLQSLPSEGRIRVEGIQIVKKHIKPRQQGEKGQVVERPGKIHISNVMLVDVDSGEKTRVSYKILNDKKVRFSRKLNKEL